MQPTADFETWWKVYPRHIAKREAWRSWHRLDGQRPPVEELIAAVERQKASEQWQREARFIPHPATWLNQQRWLDELDPPAEVLSPLQRIVRAGDEKLREIVQRRMRGEYPVSYSTIDIDGKLIGGTDE